VADHRRQIAAVTRRSDDGVGVHPTTVRQHDLVAIERLDGVHHFD
jgi:hypothetical protein